MTGRIGRPLSRSTARVSLAATGLLAGALSGCWDSREPAAASDPAAAPVATPVAALRLASVSEAGGRTLLHLPGSALEPGTVVRIRDGGPSGRVVGSALVMEASPTATVALLGGLSDRRRSPEPGDVVEPVADDPVANATETSASPMDPGAPAAAHSTGGAQEPTSSNSSPSADQVPAEPTLAVHDESGHGGEGPSSSTPPIPAPVSPPVGEPPHGSAPMAAVSPPADLIATKDTSAQSGSDPVAHHATAVEPVTNPPDVQIQEPTEAQAQAQARLAMAALLAGPVAAGDNAVVPVEAPGGSQHQTAGEHSTSAAEPGSAPEPHGHSAGPVAIATHSSSEPNTASSHSEVSAHAAPGSAVHATGSGDPDPAAGLDAAAERLVQAETLRLQAERDYFDLAARVLRLPGGTPEIDALQQVLGTELGRRRDLLTSQSGPAAIPPSGIRDEVRP